MGGSWILCGVVMLSAAADGAYAQEAAQFALGPVRAETDLRTMQTNHIVRRCCEALDAVTARRKAAFAQGTWEAWRDGVRNATLDGLGDMPFGANGCALNVRAVSRYERTGYVVENVLFESLPGLDVNASVYLPVAKDYPPPWPAVVVPVGHSAKTKEHYQVPAQVFARLGYVAVTFDPPGMAGEKQGGNDHFVDGVRCYLTGWSSNRYFVIDALRCIDYVATRTDVDTSHGVGMTGVSGGGATTMVAMLLDPRIKAAGPACCAVPNALHPVLDAYAPCTETLPIAKMTQYDDVDLLAAALPTPVLLMAGAQDEVFTEPMSRAIADEVAGSAKAAGMADRFGFFLDPGGHAYTVAMAVEFTRFMDKWLRGVEARTFPTLKREDLEIAPDDILACHPRLDRNIFSVNRDQALWLRDHRAGLALDVAVRQVANVPAQGVATPSARCGAPSLVWYHHLEEVLLRHEQDIELPATFFYPARQGWKGAAVLYFDDRGRWADLRSQGLLAGISGALDENTDGPAIFAVDVRGWGDSQPADIRYDIAGWGSRDRWNAYVSAGLGDGVLAMRIRDGLAALAYLRTRPEVDSSRIVVGGRGMGGVVALHVAAMDGAVAGVFALESLASFESLATAEQYAWPHEAFLPNVLKFYDLPELVAGLTMPALVLNPLGADRAALSPEDAKALYATALARTMRTEVIANGAPRDVIPFVREVATR